MSTLSTMNFVGLHLQQLLEQNTVQLSDLIHKLHGGNQGNVERVEADDGGETLDNVPQTLNSVIDS